ncbi:hypothetical protein DPMN_043351 [Dreissena polymorpha]|uniref:Uncharacterized protein n=1 Tax=Dreissena polymorpha TaxID=45954 RepID=A0A9D4HXV3_DREPO|nr:hypothetical protein DPMN_043351 [Dreissena polymorpha]
MGGNKKREKSQKRKKSSTTDQNEKGLKQQRQGSNSKDDVTVSDILSQTHYVLYPSESDNNLPVFDSEVASHTSNTMAESSPDSENFENTYENNSIFLGYLFQTFLKNKTLSQSALMNMRSEWGAMKTCVKNKANLYRFCPQ